MCHGFYQTIAEVEGLANKVFSIACAGPFRYNKIMTVSLRKYFSKMKESTMSHSKSISPIGLIVRANKSFLLIYADKFCGGGTRVYS